MKTGDATLSKACSSRGSRTRQNRVASPVFRAQGIRSMAKTAKSTRLKAVLLALVILWCGGAQAPSPEKIAALRERATKGNPEAQTALGTIYRNAQGVRQDLAEAARWYRKAADQGYAEAENNLGFLYDSPDYQRSVWNSTRNNMPRASDIIVPSRTVEMIIRCLRDVNVGCLR